MQADLQRRVQRYGWDRAAVHYEPSWQAQLRPAQELLLDRAALQPGERVLDVACGTGLVTFPAAEAVGPQGEVVGVDISDRMVEAGREIAQDVGTGNVTLRQMDAEELDFPDASFDVALCSLGLMYVPDPPKALSELRRILRPGGRAVASVWGERGNCGWAEVFPIVDSRVASDVCPLFFQLGTREALQVTFEQAGFTGVTTDRLPTTLHYRSADEACTAIFAGGPVALAWGRFDEQTRAEATAEYLASIEPYRNGEGYAIPGEFVVVSGFAGQD